MQIQAEQEALAPSGCACRETVTERVAGILTAGPGEEEAQRVKNERSGGCRLIGRETQRAGVSSGDINVRKVSL